MSTFHNNLRPGDKVFDVELKRTGLVSVASERRREVKVIFDGLTNAKRRDITTLRFIAPGTTEPEDVAPFDGDLPGDAPPSVKVHPVAKSSPLDAIREEKQRNRNAIVIHEAEITRLKEANARLDAAEAALTDPR